ncbi:MAG: DUF6314 family protein [Yoonia sp.]|uniref:DUF6314 family protein n=1 Tax=Yoonia sp. TaxID=2212373 RepID=UPI003EF88CD6
MLGIADFQGEWSIKRQIVDHLAGQDGTLVGQAVLTQTDPDQLDYAEAGTLTLATGAQMTAVRRYLWTFGRDCVAVCFDDGRPFHSFVPDGHAAGTDHPCGADFYQVRYDFTRWPAWSAVWTVTGPRKDYVMTTHYARISPDAPI